MTPRKIAAIVFFGLLVTAGSVYWWAYRPQLSNPEIASSGHIEVTEVDMAFRLYGHVTRLLVEEGDTVKKDQLVAELDRESLVARRDQAAGRVQELEAREASLALGIKIKEDLLQATVRQARAGVSAAEARYQTLKVGSREGEIAEAAASRDQARAEWENRKSDFERMQRLYGHAMISASQYEFAKTALESAQGAFAVAEERYKLVKAGPRQEAVTEGRANLSGSGAALQAAQAGLREVEQMNLDLKALQAQAAQAKAGLAMAEDDLAKSRLYAPFDGFVTVKDVEEGEFVQAGTPLLTLARLDEVWVKTYVPETRLGRVRLGQDAEVTTDSFAGKVYPGKVTYISPEAEFTPKNVQTKEERVKLVYRVKVTLDNPNQELKAGMPVDVVLR